MSDATAWLRGAVESATPREWRADEDAGTVLSTEGEVADLRGWEWRNDARAIAVLHNVAPELLALREAATRVLDEWHAHGEGDGDDPTSDLNYALLALNDASEALDVKVRACMEASR